MNLDQIQQFFDGMTEQTLAEMEADFNEFCAALIKSAEEGFAQAQADLDQQRQMFDSQE